MSELQMFHDLVRNALAKGEHLSPDDVHNAVRIAEANYTEPVAALIRLLATQVDDYWQALDKITNMLRGEREMEACASLVLSKSER